MNTTILALELVVIGLAALPCVRLVAFAPLRDVFPRVYALAVVALALCVVGITLVVVFAPALVLPLAAVAVAGLVVSTIHARTGFRFVRGLPPGSLSLTTSVQALADRRFYLGQARRHGPIFKTAQFQRNVVCVVGLERGHKLLRDHDESIGPSPQPFTRELQGGFLRYMDEPTYQVYGPLFRKALARPVIASASPVTLDVVRRELARMADEAASFPSGSIRPGPYLDRIAHDSFLRTLFGIMPGSDEQRRFDGPYRALGGQSLAAPLTPDTRDALVLLRGVLAAQTADLLEAGKAAEGPRCGLAELHRIDPRMPDETCFDNLLFTHKIATSNVAGLLQWLLDVLGSHPEWAARARAELDSPSPEGPDLIERIVLETLRLAQSEYLYRRLRHDVEFEGFLLPRGWLIRLCVWESHRSPATFAHPDEFDPDRFLGSPFSAAEYAPFGRSRHACNGVPLAMLVCRTVLSELVRGYDWTVTKSGPPERDLRHWSHWHPSSSLELALAPVSVPVTDACAGRDVSRYATAVRLRLGGEPIA